MIELEKIQIAYPDGRVAIRNFTCKISSGEHVALLGANGAGKSSLLLAMVGLAPVKTGRITLSGTELHARTMRQIRKKCGLVFQNPDEQVFSIKVKEDIAFGPRNLGLAEDVVSEKTARIMQLLDIEKLADYPPHKLSGGEKRKVALAGVLVMEPEVILLDEPTAFLDPRSQGELANILGGLSQTCLIATHDLNFAKKTCTRALLLNEGHLFCEGDLDAILADGNTLMQCGLL